MHMTYINTFLLLPSILLLLLRAEQIELPFVKVFKYFYYNVLFLHLSRTY